MDIEEMLLVGLVHTTLTVVAEVCENVSKSSFGPTLIKSEAHIGDDDNVDSARFEDSQSVHKCSDWIAQVLNDMSRNDEIEGAFGKTGEGLGIDPSSNRGLSAVKVLLERGAVADVAVLDLGSVR